MKFYCNRRYIDGPYGGGNHFFRAFYDFVPKLGHETCTDDVRTEGWTHGPPDVIVIAGFGNDAWGLTPDQAIHAKSFQQRAYGHCTKLVLRVNENDARKNTNTVDRMLVELSEWIDGTVFVSQWLQSYFNDRGWQCDQQCVIRNGVDFGVFKPNTNKISNGKTNIVCHHWSDHPMKGNDIYEKLDEFVGSDDRFALTYIGRTSARFKNANVIKPLYGKPLGEELAKHDVYVSASRGEPGPNHVLEAVACDLPIFVHNEGGACAEFVNNPDSVYNCWDDLLQKLMSKQFSRATRKPGTWLDSIGSYVAFSEKMCAK